MFTTSTASHSPFIDLQANKYIFCLIFLITYILWNKFIIVLKYLDYHTYGNKYWNSLRISTSKCSYIFFCHVLIHFIVSMPYNITIINTSRKAFSKIFDVSPYINTRENSEMLIEIDRAFSLFSELPSALHFAAKHAASVSITSLLKTYKQNLPYTYFPKILAL